MPNYCINTIKLAHRDADLIRQAEAAIESGRFLEWLHPFPNGEYDYNWCVENWGTKWDLDICWYDTNRDEPWSVIDFNADSAWTPPIEALKWAEAELGFEVEIYYLETGMAFMGYMEWGHEQQWDTPRTREEAEKMLKILPPSMIEALDLANEFELWFEES